MQTIAILASEAVSGYRAEIFSSRQFEGVTSVNGIVEFTRDNFSYYDVFIFIGALGICVRAIAPVIKDKYSDPAVINCP